MDRLPRSRTCRVPEKLPLCAGCGQRRERVNGRCPACGYVAPEQSERHRQPNTPAATIPQTVAHSRFRLDSYRWTLSQTSIGSSAAVFSAKTDFRTGLLGKSQADARRPLGRRVDDPPRERTERAPNRRCHGDGWGIGRRPLLLLRFALPPASEERPLAGGRAPLYTPRWRAFAPRLAPPTHARSGAFTGRLGGPC